MKTGIRITVVALIACTMFVAGAAGSAGALSFCVPGDPAFESYVSNPGVQVSGVYAPLVGNFSGSSADDIFWYGPGSATDTLWIGGTRGSFTKVSKPVSGNYHAIVGNFAGDAHDDILWYAAGTATDTLWTSVTTSAHFTPTTMRIDGSFQPIVLNNNYNVTQNSFDSILWYAPGSGADTVWTFEETSPGHHTSQNAAIPGSPQIIPLTWNSDRYADLVLYNPGAGADALWFSHGNGTFTKQAESLPGTYRPILLGGPDANYVFWDGSGTDLMWENHNGVLDAHPATVNLTKSGLALDYDGGFSDYFYEQNAPDADVFTDGSLCPSPDPDAAAGAIPLVGNFDGRPGNDIFWYRGGPATDVVYYHWTGGA